MKRPRTAATDPGPEEPNPSRKKRNGSMTSLAAGVPVAPHRARRAVKAVIFVATLTAAAAGVYEGAQSVTRHYQQPTSTVSYASPAAISRTLAGAWHTPATAGDFRPTVSIQTPDVVSVVRAVK